MTQQATAAPLLAFSLRLGAMLYDEHPGENLFISPASGIGNSLAQDVQ